MLLSIFYIYFCGEVKMTLSAILGVHGCTFSQHKTYSMTNKPVLGKVMKWEMVFYISRVTQECLQNHWWCVHPPWISGYRLGPATSAQLCNLSKLSFTKVLDYAHTKLNPHTIQKPKYFSQNFRLYRKLLLSAYRDGG